jgi:hypothetical protein
MVQYTHWAITISITRSWYPVPDQGQAYNDGDNYGLHVPELELM